MRVEALASGATPSVQVSSTVMDAVHMMRESGTGALSVLEGERLVGIFSERDLMLRVVDVGKRPAETIIADVFTADLQTVSRDTNCSEALKLMLSHRIRHLPVVDKDGSLVGLVSIRRLVQHEVENLVDSLRSVIAYFSADGPGG